jgi:hypothetical protein
LTFSEGIKTASDTFALTVVTPTPLALWKQAQFGTNAGNESIAGDLANPDGDQLVNLLEYAFGGNPNSTISVPAPVSSVVGNRINLSFTRIVANSDVTITVQGADSVTGLWSDLAESTGGNATVAVVSGVSVTETGTGTSRAVQVRDLFTSGTSAHPRRFLRLRASH